MASHRPSSCPTQTTQQILRYPRPPPGANTPTTCRVAHQSTPTAPDLRPPARLGPIPSRMDTWPPKHFCPH
eukprot:2887985-Prorocentrum_lima.AAC.1